MVLWPPRSIQNNSLTLQYQVLQCAPAYYHACILSIVIEHPCFTSLLLCVVPPFQTFHFIAYRLEIPRGRDIREDTNNVPLRPQTTQELVDVG